MKTYKVHIIRSCTVPLRINLVLTGDPFANAIRMKLERAMNSNRTDTERGQNG